MNYKLLYQLELEENYKLRQQLVSLQHQNETLTIRLKHIKKPIQIKEYLCLQIKSLHKSLKV